ncbi:MULTISPECIES: signal peptidase I [Sphingobacterium]|uniref:signal peptidase I n=1 Tax=Sphingobacterium TaxID=28453 RepID=UPI001607CEF4|nr:signal peptidase I [Sphingobacterium sp. JUb56]MBB2950158.1 signal peptidase I [Sphingobacterium sp. JUb56]
MRTFLLDVFRVSSNSMENTLTKGDIILVNKLAYGPSIPASLKRYLIFGQVGERFLGFYQPKRDDVVTFIRNNTIMVKRMIAVENDSVDNFKSGIYVNGKENNNKFVKRVYNVQIENSQLNRIKSSSKFDFQTIRPAIPGVYSFYKLNLTPDEINLLTLQNFQFELDSVSELSERVSRGGVYFVGDNRNFSTDSRTFGSVSRNNIIGKVNYVLYRPTEKKFWDRFLCRIN